LACGASPQSGRHVCLGRHHWRISSVIAPQLWPPVLPRERQAPHGFAAQYCLSEARPGSAETRVVNFWDAVLFTRPAELAPHVFNHALIVTAGYHCCRRPLAAYRCCRASRCCICANAALGRSPILTRQNSRPKPLANAARPPHARINAWARDLGMDCESPQRGARSCVKSGRID
jgi:hypothetical protein